MWHKSLDLKQAAKMAGHVKPPFVQNPKSARSSQAKPSFEKLALKKWQAHEIGKPSHKLFSIRKQSWLKHLGVQLPRELPIFLKHNLKHLSHQYHTLGENLKKIANFTNFASQFHVKSSYTFTQHALIHSSMSKARCRMKSLSRLS